MKFKVYTINFLTFLLTCIICANFFTLYLQPNVHGESNQNSDTTYEQEEQELPIEEEEEEIILEKKKFASFQSAYVHAYKYLRESKGYTSISRGSCYATVPPVIDLKQSLYVYKQINYRTNENYVKLFSQKLKSFGKDSAMQYYQKGNDVYYNYGWHNGTEFIFPEKYTTTNIADYLSVFGVPAYDLFISLYETMKPTNTRMQNDGSSFNLTFELPFDRLADGFIKFLLVQLNSSHVPYQLQKGSVSFELKMDYYGVIQSLTYTSSFSCTFPLEQLGNAIITCNGGFTITETFSNINKTIKVKNITLVV